jgi:predicted hydrocarbon binding protein
MLQARFESFLETGLQLDADLIADIVSKGWGLAGIRDGDNIIATKIPKSGYLVDYMNETDPEARRQLYCHCPRIRDVLKSPETISTTYCYCGAGYYKGIWEEILQQPVEVELLESVLRGDPVCKVAIHLPPGV